MSEDKNEDTSPELIFEKTSENTNMRESSYLYKYGSLVLLCLQNVVVILVMRHTRSRPGDMYLSSTAVIMTEILKLITSLVIVFCQEGRSLSRFLQHLNENITQKPVDCLKISIPSFIYVLQNNLLYLAVSNLDAATFQVSYQLKLLATALFSVIMLKKPLSRMQWCSLVILFIGVSIVQFQPHDPSKSEATNQSPALGMIAVLASCLMSGFAGVYFEKILKGTVQSIWLRNIQLASIGIVLGILTMLINDGKVLYEKGFFFGYDGLVWFVICVQSFGGLMVAMVVKYADNILKGFATSSAIIISCITSMILFDFQLSLQFSIGASFVMLSLYIYNRYTIKIISNKHPA